MFKPASAWVRVCSSGLRLNHKKGTGNESKCMTSPALNETINGEGLGTSTHCKYQNYGLWLVSD